MPSPFPGMNPFLERRTVWHDFHERFCTVAAESITSQVRPDYVVKIDEHVFVHEVAPGSGGLVGRGDITIAATGTEIPSAVATIQAPAQVTLPAVDRESLSFIEIRDRDTNRVVSIIELLSPTNKYLGPDRQQYVAKRSQLLQSAIHFVEIDLLRGGTRMPMNDLGVCDYCALVSRWESRPQADVWPWRLADPLPVLPIPLVAFQREAKLDLGSLLQRIYDAAGYEDYIYRGCPEPELSPQQQQWCQGFLN